MGAPMRYQPQGLIRLGQSSLARRLVSYLPLSGQVRDAVGGAWAITNGTTPLAFGGAPRGRGMAMVSSDTPSYVSRVQPAAITNSTTQPITLRYRLYIAIMPVNGIPSGIIQWADAVSTGSPRLYARMVGNASLGVGTGFLEAYIGSQYRFQAPIQAGVEYIVTHTFDGTTHRLYLNGVLSGTPAVTPWDNTTGSFYVGRGYNDTTGQHVLSDFALWSECLSPADIRADAQNPFALFDAGSNGSAYQSAIATSAPAGTGTTVSATKGTRQLTGLAASVASALTINASAGTQTLAGRFASVVTPTVITGTVASITASGLAASMSGALNINAGLGIASIAGLSATVSAPLNIAAGKASFTAVGLSASVGSGIVINAGIAAITTAGRPASLYLPVTLNLGIASITAVGNAAQVTANVPHGPDVMFFSGLVYEPAVAVPGKTSPQLSLLSSMSAAPINLTASFI